MHDIKTIRDNPAAFDQGLALRGLAAQSGELLKIDSEKRDHIQKLQDAQARRNALSKEIGEVMRAGDKAKAETLKAEVAGLKDFIASGEDRERELTQKLTDALAVIPNIPMADVPVGKDEHDNTELHTWGEKPTFNFEPRQHFDIGEWLGLMDFETAAKLSGARFVILKGQLARLERALAQFMVDLHTGTNGYTEHFVPYLVNEQALYGTGQLPKFSEDLFKTEIFSRLQATQLFASEANRLLYKQFEALKSALISDKEMLKSLFSGVKTEEDLRAGINALIEEHWSQFLGTAADGGREAIGKLKLESQRWLIPTAEVSLTNLVRESTLDERKLPLRLTAYTPCFRAEAGAAGKDTRGMIRQHQFTKVELVSITTPEQSRAELERMTKCAESVLQKLGLHYRVMLLCTGDMGFGSQMTYDIEVWLPGQKAYREISSCSVCGDFQARRMEARFKPADGKGPRYVHTLNGSGLAVGRTMVAILENYQNDDGSVTIPEVLRPYMGGAEKITRA